MLTVLVLKKQIQRLPPPLQVLYLTTLLIATVLVGPCHHGTGRPQVADGGTASDMEGSCEYIE